MKHLFFSILIFAVCGVLNAQTEITDEQYDDFIKENAPKERAFVALQWRVSKFIDSKMWDIAVKHYERYRPLFPEMDKRFERIIQLLKANEEKVILTNLGPGINTDSSEYIPIISPDETDLFFTGYDRIDGSGGEDIFVSEKISGKWGKAKSIGKSINSAYSNEAAIGISADGNQLLLFGNFEESLGHGDIFFIDKTTNGWSTVKHFPEPINSSDWECDAFLTSDGKAMLFVSERSGGIGAYKKKGKESELHYGGNTDIYITTKTSYGWSEPINLGSVINTSYAERSPFLHPDGKTLYFSSDGHYGLGGLDVFKSVRLNEGSWTQWSEPVNLGKEINTTGGNYGYKISTSGNVAYFSADVAENTDIYSITLPKEVRPDAVATIAGKVTDASGNFLEAEIKWEDLSSGKNVGLLKSNPQDGTYFITLPLGKNYGYYAEKNGYYPVSKNINLEDRLNAANITENIILVSAETMKAKGISVRINNIFFDYDKFELKPESFPELERLVRFLKENPDAKVELSGHTDNVGTDQYNQNLSAKRAQAVVDYLIAQGCKKEFLKSKGYGKTKPTDTNETEEGRANNRRVEFSFLNK